jgi:biopolymer transport protein ExbD
MAALRPTDPDWGWCFGAASRARFRRQGLIFQGFLAAAPWLAAMVAFGAVFMAGPRYLRHRGTVFELPAAPLDEGSLLMMPAAILLPAENGALLLYDDLRYKAAHPAELERFTDALAAEARAGRDELILLADARVPHEWVMAVAHAARQAGMRRVNISARAADE